MWDGSPWSYLGRSHSVVGGGVSLVCRTNRCWQGQLGPLWSGMNFSEYRNAWRSPYGGAGWRSGKERGDACGSICVVVRSPPDLHGRSAVRWGMGLVLRDGPPRRSVFVGVLVATPLRPLHARVGHLAGKAGFEV